MLFKQVMVGAFHSVYQHRVALSKALWLPFIAYLLIDFADSFEAEGPARFLLNSIELLIHTLFAITTHRIILLGTDAVPEWGLRSWSKRETSFLLHAIALFGPTSLLVLIPILVPFMPMVLAPIILILIGWLWSRFGLVFPGIAIDQGGSFKTSWLQTKDHQLLMFLVVVVLPLLLILPILLLSVVPYTSILVNVCSILVLSFQVAALSVAYQLIASKKYMSA